MLYTLLKFLGWGVLLAFIGGCIGWALRALKCRGEVARAKASTVDADELDRMRHRLANLEHVVAERDRLRIQLADVRHADSPGVVGAEVPEPEPEVAEESPSDAETDASEPADVDAAGDASGADEPASIVPDASADDAQANAAEDSTTVAGFAATSSDEPVSDTPSESDADDAAESAELDLDGAADVLGKKIKLDDLTVVEGIGPKISELCDGIGVTTWRQLAGADVADLQSMLDAAGSRYQVHKPGTWPQQAELLATGRWAEFKTLTDELDGGK